MRIISTEELKTILDQGLSYGYLVDVRDNDEYDSGHISGSINVPWDDVAERFKGIKPDRQIIVYCNTGVRAGRAAQTLDDAGFKNVALYKGGMEEWNGN